MASIKFYANYKNGKYYISGKNEKGVWFSLWKSKEFNENLYLDTNKFKGGVEINKDDLKILPNDSGAVSKVLVFKTADAEKQYCITKEEIEKNKQARQNKKTVSSVEEFLKDIIKELIAENKNLKYGKIIESIIAEKNNDADMTEIESEDLPF